MNNQVSFNVIDNSYSQDVIDAFENVDFVRLVASDWRGRRGQWIAPLLKPEAAAAATVDLKKLANDHVAQHGDFGEYRIYNLRIENDDRLAVIMVSPGWDLVGVLRPDESADLATKPHVVGLQLQLEYAKQQIQELSADLEEADAAVEHAAAVDEFTDQGLAIILQQQKSLRVTLFVTLLFLISLASIILCPIAQKVPVGLIVQES